MWKTETKEQVVEYRPGIKLPMTTYSLVNDRGVRIELRGENREQAKSFLYVDGDVKFHFYGTQYGPEGKNPSDVFHVFRSSSHKRSEDLQPTILKLKNQTNLLIIKQNILEAVEFYLLTYPDNMAPPVRNFRFSGFEEIPEHKAESGV